MAGTALITGISGQDGSYLAELLLQQGYAVHGMLRSIPNGNLDSIAPIRQHIRLHEADLLDQTSLMQLIEKVEPTEVYNLAAQSFVPASWQDPVFTGDVTGLGVARMLEAIRQVDPAIRFFQAGSSEMFGRGFETPQRETTPFQPRSPYGSAKVYAHHLTVNYRERHQMFACCGILYNHESPRRGPEFVTAKIAHAAARIKCGLDKELRLGNIEARRDWGFAGDFVRAMWLMLQQNSPEDYVIGTGVLHKVADFVRIAFEHVGLNWQEHVVIDPLFYRPVEADVLVADISRTTQNLNWRPRVEFEDLVKQMVDEALHQVQQPVHRKLRFAA